MLNRTLVCALLVPALGLLDPAFAGADGGEVSVLAAMEEGDYGADSNSRIDSVTARYAGGDRFHLRLELPWLRLVTREDLILVGGGSGGGGAVSGKIARHGQDDRGNGQAEDPGQNPGAGQSLVLQPAEARLPAEPEVRRRTASGIGDLRAGFGYRLSGGGSQLHRIDLGLEAKVPTADETDGLGTGEWDLRLGASGQYRLWSASLFAGGGWTTYGDPPGLRLEDGLDLYAGVESQPFAGLLVASIWLSTAQELVAGAGARSTLGLELSGAGRIGWLVRLTAGLGGPGSDHSVGFGLTLGVDSVLRGPVGVHR